MFIVTDHLLWIYGATKFQLELRLTITSTFSLCSPPPLYWTIFETHPWQPIIFVRSAASSGRLSWEREHVKRRRWRSEDARGIAAVTGNRSCSMTRAAGVFLVTRPAPRKRSGDGTKRKDIGGKKKNGTKKPSHTISPARTRVSYRRALLR